jgi:uncharacterized protein YegJ (DUF2314 family)
MMTEALVEAIYMTKALRTMLGITVGAVLATGPLPAERVRQAPPSQGQPTTAPATQPQPGAGKEDGGIMVWMLLKAPRGLDEAALTKAVEDALGVKLTPGDANAAVAVTGRAPHFFVRTGRCEIIVSEFDKAYNGLQQRAGQIKDPRLREAVASHKAFLRLCDMSEGLDANDVRSKVGKLVSSLAGEDTLALAVYLGRGGETVVLYTPRLKAQLAGPDGLSALKGETMTPASAPASYPAGDPEMAAAVAEARKRFPEFAEAFANRKKGEVFMVKARLSDGKQERVLWVLVESIADQTVQGTLADYPVGLEGFKKGGPVKVEMKDLWDWQYSRDGRSFGGFTIKVLDKRPKER